MIQANQQAVQTVVEEVLAQLGNRGTTTTSVGASPDGDWGVFSKVDDAVDAATRAFRQLQDKTIEDRARAIACVVRICSTQCDEQGRAETRIAAGPRHQDQVRARSARNRVHRRPAREAR